MIDIKLTENEFECIYDLLKNRNDFLLDGIAYYNSYKSELKHLILENLEYCKKEFNTVNVILAQLRFEYKRKEINKW